MSELVTFICPDCGKKLFKYRENGRAELVMWCRHCKSEKLVHLSGEDKKKIKKT